MQAWEAAQRMIESDDPFDRAIGQYTLDEIRDWLRPSVFQRIARGEYDGEGHVAVFTKFSQDSYTRE